MAPSNHNAILPMFSPIAREPEKKYRTIVADPPWDYKGAGIGNFSGKGAAGHYPTMTVEELMQLPVGAWATDDAVLFLWVTNRFVLNGAGVKIAKAWGFEPRGLQTWVKGRIEQNRLISHVGLGYSFVRNSTEQVIIAERGNPTVKNSNLPSAFIAPRGEHSEKPAAFYDHVEHVAYGPYLDVFARSQRFNWDTFGNESFNFGTDLPAEAFI